MTTNVYRTDARLPHMGQYLSPLSTGEPSGKHQSSPHDVCQYPSSTYFQRQMAFLRLLVDVRDFSTDLMAASQILEARSRPIPDSSPPKNANHSRTFFATGTLIFAAIHSLQEIAHFHQRFQACALAGSSGWRTACVVSCKFASSVFHRAALRFFM